MNYAFGFYGIVTNAVTFGLEVVLLVAKLIGFGHVVAKLWWANHQNLEIESQNTQISIDGIDAVVVGNKPVPRPVIRGESGAAARERLYCYGRGKANYDETSCRSINP